MSAIGLTGSEPVAPGPEEGAFLLLVKPAEEFLESRIGLDLFNPVERVPQFVVRPGLMDEILAGVAGRRRVPSALAARDHVVPSRGHLSLTKCAAFGHAADSILLQKKIAIRLPPGSNSFESDEPLAGLFHQLTPSAFKNRNSARKGLGRSIYFAFRGSKWYARPVTLRIQALI